MPPTLARDQIDALADRALAALREASIRGATASKSPQAVTVRIPDQTRRADAERILRGLIATVSSSTFAQPQPNLAVSLLADGAIELRPTEAALVAKASAAVEQSLEIVRRRLDGQGVAEPTIQSLGHGRILVQLPGVKDPNHIIEILKTTARLTFHRVSTEPLIDGRPPAGYELLPGSNGDGPYAVEKQADAAGRPPDRRQRVASISAPGSRWSTFRFDSHRRPALRRHHPRQCRRAVRHRARRQGAQRAGDPRADHRRVAARSAATSPSPRPPTLAALLRAGALPAPLDA